MRSHILLSIVSIISSSFAVNQESNFVADCSTSLIVPTADITPYSKITTPLTRFITTYSTARMNIDKIARPPVSNTFIDPIGCEGIGQFCCARGSQVNILGVTYFRIEQVFQEL
ncbi:hypothetical protein LX64_00327 [Chitinophaga skermanii]|uniref:Hydrophobin n=1 Tax=Chitinophaga skermanii TaxID=331697 RepID=A0A327R259_9BACT|nr:hypothetical protein LX64_00327 [Chitinophaga skermanii]